MRKALLLAAVVCLAVVPAMAHELVKVDMNAKDWAAHAKDVLEILVILVGSAGYFLYRSGRGSLTHNLSLAVECTRTEIPDATAECLIVTAKLSKGENFQIELHDAQVRVSWPGAEPNAGLPISVEGMSAAAVTVKDAKDKIIGYRISEALIGISPTSLKDKPLTDQNGRQLANRATVRWEETRRTAPFLGLAPGDETQFAQIFKIPIKAICTVEVVILGQRSYRWWLRWLRSAKLVGQWRASAISAPLEKPTN